MLKQLTEGVWTHQSTFLQSNTTIVQGQAGLLLIDPGITRSELAELGKDIQDLGQPVVAGYSTHPHWDHLLWHDSFGDVPRYCTVQGEAEIKDFMSDPNWRTNIVPLLPADLAELIPIDDWFGNVTALPAGTTQLPWEGPVVQIIEHQGHALGSAALLIKERGVLVAGDMVSDIFVPFIELEVSDPVKEYLAALELLEGIAGDVKFVVPGHGYVGDAGQLRARLAQDRAYVEALRAGGGADDPRLTEGPQKELLATVHSWQTQQLAQKKEQG